MPTAVDQSTNARNDLGASPTTGSDEIKAQGSPPTNAAGSIAEQSDLSDLAIESTFNTAQILRSMMKEHSALGNFPASVILSEALATAHTKARTILDNPTKNGFSDAKAAGLEHLLLPENHSDYALSQLFAANKSGELPDAKHLLDQMREVLTGEALRDPNDETAVRNKKAMQAVIGHLNEKMGCASTSGPVSTLVKKIVNRLLNTFCKPFQGSAHIDNKANAALSEKHALLEFFCDLMTKQGSHTQSETVSLLFNACPHKNLEKLKNAFREAATHYPENKEKQEIFKNMADCLQLAIENGKFINKIEHQDSLGMRILLNAKKYTKHTNNPDVMLAAVQKMGHMLAEASDELKNNPVIVMAAVKQCSWAIEYASEALKNDPEIIRAAGQQNG